MCKKVKPDCKWEVVVAGSNNSNPNIPTSCKKAEEHRFIFDDQIW